MKMITKSFTLGVGISFGFLGMLLFFLRRNYIAYFLYLIFFTWNLIEIDILYRKYNNIIYQMQRDEKDSAIILTPKA